MQARRPHRGISPRHIEGTHWTDARSARRRNDRDLDGPTDYELVSGEWWVFIEPTTHHLPTRRLLMPLNVTLVQGGGTGLDQAPAVQRILAAAGIDLTWDEHLAGLASIQQGGEPLPDAMLQSVRRTGLALKTALLSPPGPVNFNVKLRRELGMFASVRPLKN